jgi:hypothetical protein
MNESGNATKRKDRPAKGESRAQRPGEGDPRYEAIGQFRDKLTIAGKDPEWTYRWTMDESHSGQRIFDATQDGWDLVDATKESHLKVGARSLESVEGFGSLVRKPADREGHYLYLMRIPTWVYDKRQAAKQDRVDELEEDLFREHDSDDNEMGMYGQNRIKHEQRKPRETGWD